VDGLLLCATRSFPSPMSEVVQRDSGSLSPVPCVVSPVRQLGRVAATGGVQGAIRCHLSAHRAPLGSFIPFGKHGAVSGLCRISARAM
jgi:hypothetical protein